MKDTAAFVIANTERLSPPLVPEIVLHLATESMPIWQKTEDELGEMNVPPPYWAFAWAGGQALARYILDTPMLCAKRSVIDLGTGSGLVAIAAKIAGADRVLAADVDSFALVAAHLNAAANGVAIETTNDDLLVRPLASFDLVFVADLFYERDLAQRVMSALDRAAAGGAEILVGDPRRSYFPPDRFECLARYPVPVTRDLEDAEIKNSAVWRLKPSTQQD